MFDKKAYMKAYNRSYWKAYYESHKEYLREYYNKWRQVNLGEQAKYHKAYLRDWQLTNRDHWHAWFKERGHRIPNRSLSVYHHPEDRSFNIGVFIYMKPLTSGNEALMTEELKKCKPMTQAKHARLHGKEHCNLRR